MSLIDGAIRTLVDSSIEVVGAPEWFAGDRLAVVIRQAGKATLLIQRADGSEARTYNLLRGGSGDQLRVAPDGRSAVFVGRDGGFGTVELLDLASGRQTTLVASPDDFADGNAPEGRGIGALAWSEDSKRVLYVADIWTPTPTVRQVTLAGVDEALRPLPVSIYGQAQIFFPSPTRPDVVELAGARNFAGAGAVVLVPIAAGLPRVLLPQFALGGPLSPDGHAVAVQMPTADRQGVGEIRVVSVDGSTVRTIPLSFVPLPAAVKWHPDGRRLLALGREKSGAPLTVYSVPIDGGGASVVARVGSTRDEALAVSADGRFIAVTMTGTAKDTWLKLDYDVSGIFPSAGKR
ncbi:MAG: hypothetical protein ABIP53_11170 [Candidatus Limnocylindrales bacterium]